MAPTILGRASRSLPFVFHSGAAATSVLAHANDAEIIHGHSGTIDEVAINNTTEYPSTYFALTEHVGTIYAHITFMVLAWVFILPIGKPSLSILYPYLVIKTMLI